MHVSSSRGRALWLLASCPPVHRRRTQFREVIRATDAHGMTILHHAVHGNGNEQAAARSSTTAPSQTAPSQERLPSAGAGHGGSTQTEPPPTAGERLATVTEGGGPVEGEASEEVPFVLDPRLPVIQAALEFARANLWMPEVRVPDHSPVWRYFREKFCSFIAFFGLSRS